VIAALLHGAQDALAFLTIVPGAISALGVPLHYLLVFGGALLFLAGYLGRRAAPRLAPI
jgi:hypothetical protein